MATNDRAVSIYPYFQVAEGKLDEFRALCEEFVSTTTKEPKCFYYGFSFSGNLVHCRESYEGAEGLLTHLTNVADLLRRALTLSTVARLEVHGMAEELAKLKEPLADLNPTYFALEFGFRSLQKGHQ